MNDIDTKQSQAVDLSSTPVSSLPSELEGAAITIIDEQVVDNVEEIKNQQDNDEAATLSISQDEFSDAIDDTNEKTAQDLSNVISALQGTVMANLPTKQEPLVFKNEEQVQVEVDNVLDTIPEVEINDLGSSLIKPEESSPTKKEDSVMDKEDDIKANIDIPLNDEETVIELGGEEDITAGSEPDSPRPRAASMSDLKIATHFEQIRNSIDVPAGQNMADFVTPPTPGLAPPSMLSAELGDQNDDDNDDDLHPTKSESAQISTSTSKDGSINGTPASTTTSTTNVISLSNIDFSTVRPNHLTPRAQEKFGNNYLVIRSAFAC
jgi:hypothetical protein